MQDRKKEAIELHKLFIEKTIKSQEAIKADSEFQIALIKFKRDYNIRLSDPFDLDSEAM